MAEEDQEKTCPRCAEQVKAAALVCRFCGHEFTPESKSDGSSSKLNEPGIATVAQTGISLGRTAENDYSWKGQLGATARKNKIRWILGTTIILAIALGGAFAIFYQIKSNGDVAAKVQLHDGFAAYDRADYVTALRLFRPLAAQGDAKAQNVLGLMLHDGKGVPQDFAEALKWYREAADQGLGAAQFNLGNMYYAGQGVTQNYVEAMKWFKKAADQGNADAIDNIGAMYAKGQGVAVSFVDAEKWYRLAAQKGNATAQNNLGHLYEDGQGIPRNSIEAFGWFSKAAQQGLPTAQKAMGAMLSEGHGTAKNEKEAVQWFRKAANAGDAEAQYDLGVMYYQGRGTTKSNIDAFNWWAKASLQGYDHAADSLKAIFGEHAIPSPEIKEAQAWAETIQAHVSPAMASEVKTRYTAAFQQGGMSGVVRDIQACYASTTRQKTPAIEMAVTACLWYDVSALLMDKAWRQGLMARGLPDVGPASPYLADDAFAARMKMYTSIAFGDDKANSLQSKNAQTPAPNQQQTSAPYVSMGVAAQSNPCAEMSGDTRTQCASDLITNKNYAAARKVYGDMASSGDDFAAYSIGETYEKGEGAPIDYVLAYKWYDIAVALNARAIQQSPPLPDPNGPATDESVKQTMHNMIVTAFQKHAISSRAQVAVHLNPAQLVESQNLSRQWQAAYLTPPKPQDSATEPVQSMSPQPSSSDQSPARILQQSVMKFYAQPGMASCVAMHENDVNVLDICKVDPKSDYAAGAMDYVARIRPAIPPPPGGDVGSPARALPWVNVYCTPMVAGYTCKWNGIVLVYQ